MFELIFIWPLSTTLLQYLCNSPGTQHPPPRFSRGKANVKAITFDSFFFFYKINNNRVTQTVRQHILQFECPCFPPGSGPTNQGGEDREAQCGAAGCPPPALHGGAERPVWQAQDRLRRGKGHLPQLCLSHIQGGLGVEAWIGSRTNTGEGFEKEVFYLKLGRLVW